MRKRVVLLFFLCTFMLSILSFRLISINASDYAKTASSQNSKSITVEDGRGTIYDRNMQPITNSQDAYVIAVKPTAEGLLSVSKLVGAERLQILSKELSAGNPCILQIPQAVNEGKDTKLIVYKRRYADKQYASHLIGYVDKDQRGVTGIEKTYDEYLATDVGKLKVSFSVDAFGRALTGAPITASFDDYNIKKGVVLSIDLNVQKALEDAMDNYCIESGSAVALDPNTGAVLAMVSRPDFDPSNVAVSLETANSPLVNKALLAYSVGSTFKAIVAATALEEDAALADYTYTCNGRLTLDGTDFSCFSSTAHGTENMEQALMHSCNTYFIKLTEKVGAEKILNTALNLGFGRRFVLTNNVVSKPGNLPALSEFDSPASLANLGFGQGSLLATPLQLATAFATIANGGTFFEPYLFEGYISEDGDFIPKEKQTTQKQVLKHSTCERLSKMLQYVVDENAKAKPESVTAAGKTATAQSGQFIDGVEICHSWFAGWYPAENPTCVIVIMKEQGNTGLADCAPVFKNAVDSLTMKSN